MQSDHRNYYPIPIPQSSQTPPPTVPPSSFSYPQRSPFDESPQPRVLLPEERDLLLRSRLPPQLALTMLGSLISSSRMTIDSKTHMDESVRRLQECLDCCEKIIRTPLPLSYSRWAMFDYV